MLRITKIAVLISFIIIGLGVSYAQKPDTAKTDDKTDIKVLEERVKGIEEKNNEKFEAIRNEIDYRDKARKDEIDDKFLELNGIMLMYVGFVIAIMGLIGFLIKFFGRKAIIGWIRERIKDDVNAITDQELEDTWREGFRKFVEQKVNESEQILEKALKERLGKFEKDREDYIKLKNEMLEMKEFIAKKEPLSVKSFEMLKEFDEKLESIKKEDEYTADDWFFKGVVEASQNNFEAAINSYKSAINLNPHFYMALNNIGYSYILINKPENAIDYLEKATQLKPNIPDAYNNMGFSYFRMRKYNTAQEYFEKSLQIDKNNVNAHLNLAELMIVKNEYKESLKYIKNAEMIVDIPHEKSILMFLKCIALKLLNVDSKDAQFEFNSIIEQVNTTTWSPNEIEKWLSETDIPDETRKFIQEKTELLKKKRK